VVAVELAMLFLLVKMEDQLAVELILVVAVIIDQVEQETHPLQLQLKELMVGQVTQQVVVVVELLLQDQIRDQVEEPEELVLQVQ
jgi:hypothetical protein